MAQQQHTPYVYLFQPEHQLLMLSEALQALYGLPRQQRFCPPQQWLSCYSVDDRRRLTLAFSALHHANHDDRLQLTLMLMCQRTDGARLQTRHQLCVVRIAEQRFICGRVSPLSCQTNRPLTIARQAACWSARPSAEISQSG